MSRSQRAVRFRENFDSGYVAALQRGEPSLRSPADQRAALIAQGQTVGVPPACTVAPAITGTLTVGQVQTATNGTWTGQGSVTFARQWFRRNFPIPGATALTYTLTAADAGCSIFCRVTATDAWGTATIDSNIRQVP